MSKDLRLLNAVVLAGGMGTRLRPITNDLPKPLAPILGKSVLTHIFELLSKNGISKATLTTMFLPEMIKEKFGNSYRGVGIEYVNEDIPLGTAGGVKNAMGSLNIPDDESFFVLSGDGICNFNLQSALAFHREKNADVTIVTYRTKKPLEYGVVFSDSNGLVTSFCEKPPWAQVVADTVNTGIYIIKKKMLSYIPDGKTFDFSKNLFPLLLKQNKGVYAYNAEGYWCDIGDLPAYYSCNIDALCGKISGLDVSGSYTEKELIHFGCSFESPVWVSKSAVIERGTKIEKYSIIGDNVILKKGSEVSASVIHENVAVGENTKILGSIICRNTNIGELCELSQGTVVGACSIVLPKVKLNCGTRISNGKTVGKGFCVLDEIFFEDERQGIFCEDGIFAGYADKLLPDYYVKIGYSVSKALYKGRAKYKNVRVGVMHDGTPAAKLICDSLLCGIRTAGAKSYSLSEGFLSQAAFLAATFITDIVLYPYIERDGKAIIKMFDGSAIFPKRSFERDIESIFVSEKKDENSALYETESFDGVSFLYFSELVKYAEKLFSSLSQSNFKIAIEGNDKINSPSVFLKNAIVETLSGIEVVSLETAKKEGLPIFSVNDSGLVLSIKQNNIFYDNYHITALIIAEEAESGALSFALPYLSPAVYRTITTNKGAKITEYLYSPNEENFTQKELLLSQWWSRDALFATVKLLSIMAKYNVSLQKLFEKIPRFEVYTRELSVKNTEEDNRAEIMRRLYKRAEPASEKKETEGVRLVFSNGIVTVVPKRTGGFKLIGEAENAEAAEEIFGEVLKDIK